MDIHIIPSPKRTISKNISAQFPCRIITQYEDWQPLTEVFAESFKKINNYSITCSEGGAELVYDKTLKKGAYILEIEESIKLYASDYEGASYSLATLLMIASAEKGKMNCPCVKIEDCADKEYRALMVDVAREWHPAETVLKYIDICFLFKIKYFHIHFIDDQSYTLPSHKFPEIITKERSYTFEEIYDFNEYAKKRGVTLIPEFEVPGHAHALINAYPELFANDMSENTRSSLVTENGDVLSADSLVCAGSEKTIFAIEELLKEICEMFQNSPYIHIGGDEASISMWNNCNVCREYMKKNSIHNEYELYSDFIARVARIVLKLGKTPIVWEGFPKKGAEKIPRETVVMAWESYYHMAYDLLDEGFKIINCSWQPLYIVNSLDERWTPMDIMRWNVYNWQHWWTESEACLNPINVTPTENVLGAQICAWESTFEQEINCVMENLAALSERTWNVKRVCDDAEFKAKHKKIMQKAARLIAAK